MTDGYTLFLDSFQSSSQCRLQSYHQVVNKNFWLKQNIDLALGLTASSHTIFHSRAVSRSELQKYFHPNNVFVCLILGASLLPLSALNSLIECLHSTSSQSNTPNTKYWQLLFSPQRSWDWTGRKDCLHRQTWNLLLHDHSSFADGELQAGALFLCISYPW